MIILFFKSLIIGICAILPGVSGSVIAVSLGVYNKILNIINKKDYINNRKYLLTVLLGIIIGVFFTSNIILYIFKYKTIIYYILIGIIISEIPFIIKKIHEKGRINIISFIISFIASLILDLLNGKNMISNYSSFKLFIGGILFSFGKIFPGISSSFFLLVLGIYEKIIILITKPSLLITNFLYYLPFIIGTLLGIIIFLKLLSYLINNKYTLVYSMILGFISSSVILLFPKFSFDAKNIIGIILMFTFFGIFIYIKKKNGE